MLNSPGKNGPIGITLFSPIYTTLISILVLTTLVSSTNHLEIEKAFAVSAKSLAGDKMGNAVTYENSTYGLRIKYPVSWTEESLPHGIAITAPGSLLPSFSDMVEVLVYPTYCSPLDRIVDHEIEHLKTLNDFELTKISTTTMAGLPAKMVLYSYSDTSIGNTKVMESITSNGNYAYYVSYYSKPQNYQSHIQFARDFIKSVSIDSNIKPVMESSDTKPNYLIYENSTFGIRVEYPGNWSLYEEGSTVDNQTNSIAEFEAPCEGPNDGYSESLSISVRSVAGENATINDYLDDAIDYYKTIIKKFKIIESSNNSAIGANESPAYKLVFAGLQESTNTNIKASVRGILVNNKLYFIDYYAAAPKFSSYLPNIERMTDSIKFGSVYENPLIKVTTKQHFIDYSDAFNGFSLKYSSDWELDRDPGSAVLAFKYPFGDFIAKIRVIKMPTTGFGSTLNRFVTNYADELGNTFSNFHILSRTQSGLGSLDATQLVFTYDAKFEGDPKAKGKIMQTIAVKGKNAYIVSFGTSSADYPYQLPAVQAMLNSFEFLPEPATISGKYVNQQIGLKIDFPEGWSGHEVTQEGKILTFIFPQQEDKGTVSDKDIPLMAIVTYNKSDMATGSSGQYGNNGQYGSDVSCKTPSDIHYIILNNMSAVQFKVDCEKSDSNSPLNLEGYYFEKGDRVIIVGFGTYSKSSRDIYIQEFIKSLNSLSIEGTDDINTGPLIQI